MSANKLFYVGIKGVIVKDGKVLILRANFKNERRDIWEMPGGRIDNEESMFETLERELKEELPNINNIKIHNLLDTYLVPWEFDNGAGLILIFYRVSANFNGDPQISDEHLDIKWAKKDEALKLTADNCKKAIKAAFESI